MEILKRAWNWFLDLFGLRKNSKYVKGYLNEANMRSGIYMAAIIFILEIWLIVRQHDKYIIPQTQAGMNYFESLFDNTSCFWLLLFVGFSMFAYCIFYRDRKANSTKTVVVIALASVGLILCALLPLEKTIKSWNPKYAISNILLITLYASIALFQISVIAGTFLQIRGIKNEWLTSVTIISLFALVCLVFGVRVSYTDFFTGSSVQPKQFICFLMFTIYVGCLLIWRPYISIGLLGGVFLFFYLMIKRNVGDITVKNNYGEIIGLYEGASGKYIGITDLFYYDTATNSYIQIQSVSKYAIHRTFLEGDEVNYLTFFISLTMVCISIYAQRIAEAKKDEELELLATRDKLTGLYAFEYFLTLTKQELVNSRESEYIYLFVDITSFKIFNDQRGFTAGNNFLKVVGMTLEKHFPNGYVSRQSDDHFIVFCKNSDIERRLEEVDQKIKALDPDIKPGICAGGYITKNNQEDPHRSVEKARYASSILKQHGAAHVYLEYDQKMHDNYRLVQYVVRHIDEAIANNYLRAYYQPVVWSKNNKLCSVEALCRWIDPKYGFMNPGLFIGALEDSQLIYKLDVAMLRLVCHDLKHNKDNGLPVIPVSINFSRLDFMVMNVPEVISSTLDEFGLDHDLVHVEVTESALLEEGDVLKRSMKELKEKGFTLWLDDFGSGYSSFNALKDYDFDVLKLDMQFLVGFEKNSKSKALIESVITMAEKIGMKTLSEGVETKEQAEFLKDISCGRLQGYLYGKPLAYDDLMAKINSGELVISNEL